MKPVLTPEEAAALDRETQARGTTGADLMEGAGRAVARACVDLVGGTYGRRALVVCGGGNNGGDGFVAARHLARWGMRVAVAPLAPIGELRGDAAANAARLAEDPVVRDVGADPARLARELDRADVAVDAIFGTGFHGVADGTAAAAIDVLARSGLPVVAVDVPSGVDGATGEVLGPAVNAATTVTFGAAKVGALVGPGAELAGDVRVVDIGFPDDLVGRDGPGAWLVEPTDVAAILPPRPLEGHKRLSGTLVLVVGSRAITGAARLAATAALRAGAGYVVVCAPASAMPVIQAGLVEPVFVPLPETSSGSIARDALAPVLERLDGAGALAVGPGLSREPETATFVRDLVAASPVPAVVDADGLNAFEGEASAIADRKAEAVLTPHLGELLRLTAGSAEDVADRLRAARGLAAEADAVALVKGNRTVIADPGGEVRINPTGSPALATAGTGDVLTGVIGAFVARGAAPLDAAAAAAYVHGLAGRLGGDGLVSGELPALIPVAIDRIGAA